VPIKETIFNGETKEIDTLPFKFEVNLDEIDKFYNVRLIIRPLDPDVVIARDYYDANNKHIETRKIEQYENNVFYDDEADEIRLNVFNGFDVAIFNMCSLLGIGRVGLDDAVPYSYLGFAPVHDKVQTITFTLEEFKQLDGFVALFKFTPHFILFKGLLIGANYIHSDVHDGDVVPDFRSEKLLRGEKLFKWD